MKGTQKQLESLHGALVEALLQRVRDNIATAADLAVARQLLKDNGIDAIPKESSPLDQLAKALPFPGEEDGEDATPRH